MTEQEVNLNKSLESIKLAVNVLTVMVAGFFLQQGVTGLLWVICWCVTIYGLIAGAMALAILGTGLVTYLIATVLTNKAQNTEEDTRLQKLNEVYNNIKNKTK